MIFLELFQKNGANYVSCDICEYQNGTYSYLVLLSHFYHSIESVWFFRLEATNQK